VPGAAKCTGGREPGPCDNRSIDTPKSGTPRNQNDREGSATGSVAEPRPAPAPAPEQPEAAAPTTAETLLAQTQRIEAIGRLAGGIAHDFNNLLGVIAGYGELTLESLPPEHPARASVDQILLAAGRAAQLTRQLLAFSRKQVQRPRSLDLYSVVADLEPMLRSLLGERVELTLRGAPGLGRVLADPAQLQQILVHLAENAREAMPNGGRATIEVGPRDLTAGYVESHPPSTPGPYVLLAVSDTGVGMSAEARRRCFEPFFTTKAAGAGSGLGLSTVYGIVKQSGGFIWVYSEPGLGSTFKIYLPRIDRSAATADPSSQVSGRAGSETVLVVEDMAPMRQMIQAFLARAGYTVLQAADGEAALALARSQPTAIDLLLTDVVMPKLGGADLARELVALHPAIRVLFMSGYTEGAISQQGILTEGVDLLEKPFTADQLLSAVRHALARPLRI
jgi:signal transduction histidine kinase/ActR/RegA family two-component response regulator